jgi:5-methyltetrahydrofolate--homocysteine methyltransferase
MEYQAIFEGVIAGDRPGVQALVTAALENDATAQRLLDEALIPAMGEVGRMFEAGEVYVPEMLVAAHTMQGALDILRPLLGDLHDIGKNLVGLMLEGAGFEVQDLGTDVKPDKFVEAARNGVQVIGMSALLTTTMPAIERSIAALVEAGIRDGVKVIVGGAPVTAEFAQKVGADGFASDAASAVRMTKGLLNA